MSFSLHKKEAATEKFAWIDENVIHDEVPEHLLDVYIHEDHNCSYDICSGRMYFPLHKKEVAKSNDP
jgi:hypothetical protein